MERISHQICPGIDPGCCRQQLSFDGMPMSVSELPMAEHSRKYSTKDTESLDALDTRAQGRQAKPITATVEEFLSGFQGNTISGIVAKLHSPLEDLVALEKRHTEPATRALECCMSMVVQTKEQMKNANFARYTSLCFFLIWEAFTCKSGKAGSRMVGPLFIPENTYFYADQPPDQRKNEGGWLQRYLKELENYP